MQYEFYKFGHNILVIGNYLVFLMNSLIRIRIIHIFSSTSAKLNIGKFHIEIKSLTHHKNILSIKFPNVQAINILKKIRDICFIFNKYVNINSAMMLIIITINIFTCIHRDIHRLNTGLIKSMFDNKFWL